MAGISWLFLALGALGVIDALRRPTTAWVEADRDRGFWVVMMVFLNVLAVAVYLLFVVPRFPRGGSTTDASFLKP